MSWVVAVRFALSVAVAVRLGPFSEINCNCTGVPAGKLAAWISTGTGPALLIATSGTVKEPEGLGLTETPATLTTLIVAGVVDVKVAYGDDTYGALEVGPLYVTAKASRRSAPAWAVDKLVQFVNPPADNAQTTSSPIARDCVRRETNSSA